MPQSRNKSRYVKKVLIMSTVGKTLKGFLLPYIEGLKGRGYEVGILANLGEEGGVLEKRADQCFHVPMSRRVVSLSHFRNIKLIGKILKKNEYSCIFVHTPVAAFLVRLAKRLYCKKRGPKILYMAHGFHFHKYGGIFKNFIYKNLERLLAKETDGIITINQEDFQAAHDNCLAREGFIFKMPGVGVNIEHYKSGEEEAYIRKENAQYFLVAGELNKDKRVEDAIKALAKCKNKSVNLVIVGDGPLRKNLKVCARKNGVAKRVMFLGHVEDIRGVLKRSVGLIHASRREGLCRVIQEAMVVGRPVIGTDARGVEDLLFNGRGFISKVGDIDAIARHIDEVLSGGEEIEIMCDTARHWVVQFEEERVVQQCLEIIERVVEGNNDKLILTTEIEDYHWADRKQLYTDYKTIERISDSLIESLGEALNKYHGKQYSRRYWRIVTGPWVNSIVPMLWDRYQSISASKKIISSNLIVPRDYCEFRELSTTDEYNQQLYLSCIADNIEVYVKRAKANRIPNIRQICKLLVERMFCVVPDRFNKVVFIHSYFSLKNLFKLQVKLKQLPYLRGYDYRHKECAIGNRERLEINPVGDSDFEKFVSHVIRKMIPVSYVEGYEDLETRIFRLPKNIRKIVTAQPDGISDMQRIWIARACEEGAQLNVVQHGGHFGMGLWSLHERQHIEIADKYFSWGWEKDEANKVEKMPAGKLIDYSKWSNAKSKNILWVGQSFSRYTYGMHSVPGPFEYKEYINGQIDFCEYLNQEVLKKLKLRFHQQDYGWGIKERLRNEFPHIQFSKEASIKKAMKNAQVVIVTGNTTTLLESLVANKPTLCFWEPGHWELNSQAQSYFDKLKEVGILHENGVDAAQLLNAIEKNPMSWWLEKNRQEAVSSFLSHYGYTCKDWKEVWAKELLSA